MSARRTATWLALRLAPVLLPLAVMRHLLVSLPWLDSQEAALHRRNVLLAEDARVLHALEAAAALPVLAMTAAALGLGLLWLAAVRAWPGPAALRGAWPALLGRTAAGHAPLAAFALAGTLAVALQTLGDAAGARLDALLAPNPLSASTHALLLGMELTVAVGLAVVLGLSASLLAADLPRPDRRARLEAMLLCATLASALVVLGTQLSVSVTDADTTLAAALGLPPPRAAAPPARKTLVVVVREHVSRYAVLGVASGLPLRPEATEAAGTLLAARGAWSVLAPAAEAYAIAGALFALEPDAAREVAWLGLWQRGSPAACHAFLVSAGHASTTAPVGPLLAQLLRDDALVLGPSALQSLALAQTRRGHLDEARAALAGAWGSGGRLDARSPLIIPEVTDGVVVGRLLVDGVPHSGRVGLVPADALFVLPPEGETCRLSWLLRVGATAHADATGRFALGGVTSGEKALVVLLDGRAPPLSISPALPRIGMTPEQRRIELPDIDLRSAAAR